MTIRTLALTALSLALLTANIASAQNYRPKCEGPGQGLPTPPGSSYFLGVYTSTIQVSPGNGGGESEGPVLEVAPGYGEAVYGQRVNQVVPNSPAYHAGLEPGDIIIDANGVPMDSKNDLVRAIQNSGGRLEMKVIDSRTNQLQWVVAQLDAQDQNPVLSLQSSPPSNPNQSFGSSNGSSGQRRPPVGRRR